MEYNRRTKITHQKPATFVMVRIIILKTHPFAYVIKVKSLCVIAIVSHVGVARFIKLKITVFCVIHPNCRIPITSSPQVICSITNVVFNKTVLRRRKHHTVATYAVHIISFENDTFMYIVADSFFRNIIAFRFIHSFIISVANAALIRPFTIYRNPRTRHSFHAIVDNPHIFKPARPLFKRRFI